MALRLLPHMMVSRHSLDGLTLRWRGHDTDTGFVFGSGDDERPEWLSAGTGTQGRLVASADAQHRARQRTSTHTVSSDGCDRSGSLCSGGPRSVSCLFVSLACQSACPPQATILMLCANQPDCRVGLCLFLACGRSSRSKGGRPQEPSLRVIMLLLESVFLNASR